MPVCKHISMLTRSIAETSGACAAQECHIPFAGIGEGTSHPLLNQLKKNKAGGFLQDRMKLKRVYESHYSKCKLCSVKCRAS